MKPMLGIKRRPGLTMLLASVGLAGCAQTACTQPDVLAYVDNARQSGDLYAIGLTDGAVRETPLRVHDGPATNRHAALCSAWMLSRNPAFQPGNGQPRYLRERQDFTVVKLATGYKVSLYRPQQPAVPGVITRNDERSSAQ